ncbi:MAG TPA: PAC2 family protein [Candidatus Dormibacteraeota bacterium]|nr:PAC2 family protein [Candidatus Dormibacteraeota bacterium]
MSLYRLRRGLPELTEPTVVVALDGWVDAGSAATNAAATLAEGGRIIASFDADEIFDYRARRPTLQIVHGKPRSLDWPELNLRATRIAGRDVLVLTGAEPDYRWHELSSDIVALAQKLGVAQWISLGAIPAAVPHTRPVPILGTESRAGLLKGGTLPGPEGVLRVPAAAISIFDISVAKAGIAAVGYFAQIPHYVSGPYPEASIELLRALGKHLDVALDMANLPEEARLMRVRLDAAAAREETTKTYVERLETLVDEARLPSGDDLISEIERFLREGGNQGGSGRPN